MHYNILFSVDIGHNIYPGAQFLHNVDVMAWEPPAFKAIGFFLYRTTPVCLR